MLRIAAAACFLPVFVMSSPAHADCAGDHARSCYAVESARPASTRGGLSASEFCAADAVVKCQGARTSPVGSGVGRVGSQPAEVDRALDYLTRRKAQDPARADADFRACSVPGQDVGATLNCMMQRERDRASGQSRNTAAAPPPAAAPAAPKTTASPRKEADDTTAIAVEGGMLRIVAGDPHGTKSSIRYNDNLIREFDGVYLSIRAVVALDFGADTVLIYSTNLGGSGTDDAYGLVSIGPKGRIYETELPTGSGRFEYHVTQDRIAFELGLEEGREVRAVYANGRLDVTRSAAPKTGLKAQDCDFLYNGVLTECAGAHHIACRYDDMSISMASQRPVNMMAADDPNFRRQDFETACEQACKAKRKPAFAAFRKAICQPR
ncbi:hypothetical protein AX289_17460 [Methylorubrum populi]|nr:hypothetical protein AX289_17460 [Methylorubrum populi]